jgi:large subunit ribosomal protein L21
MYAIVRTGGKQYRVEEGRSVVVERLPGEEGATIELGEVLLIAEDGSVTIGTPMIEGARVLAQVDQQGRSPKIIIFKYKNKVRTRKKQGHRQGFTKLTVQEILRPGEEAKAKPPRARRKKAEEEAETPEAVAEAPEAAAEAVAGAITEAPAVEEVAEAPKPRTLRQAQGSARRAAAKAKEKPAAKAKAEKAEKPKRTAKKAPAKDDKEKKPPARRRILRRKKED